MYFTEPSKTIHFPPLNGKTRKIRVAGYVEDSVN